MVTTSRGFGYGMFAQVEEIVDSQMTTSTRSDHGGNVNMNVNCFNQSLSRLLVLSRCLGCACVVSAADLASSGLRLSPALNSVQFVRGRYRREIQYLDGAGVWPVGHEPLLLVLPTVL